MHCGVMSRQRMQKARVSVPFRFLSRGVVADLSCIVTFGCLPMQLHICETLAAYLTTTLEDRHL